MDFDVGDFNAHLATMGQDAMWSRSYACPCVSPSSGAADKTCTFCSGLGHLWDAGVQVLFGKTGSDVRKKWSQFGMYDEGDTVMTVGSDSPAYGIAAFDRVLMLEQTEPFSMNLVPGVNDRVPFPVVSVDRVFTKENGALVEKPLPTVVNGAIVWASGAPTTTYSLSGRRPVEFYAYTDQPFDRPHQQGLALPRRIVLKRFDVLRRSV